MILKPE